MLYRGNDLTCATDPNYPKKRERGVRFLLTAQSIDIRALISMPKVQVLESGGGRGYNVHKAKCVGSNPPTLSHTGNKLVSRFIAVKINGFIALPETVFDI